TPRRPVLGIRMARGKGGGGRTAGRSGCSVAGVPNLLDVATGCPRSPVEGTNRNPIAAAGSLRRRGGRAPPRRGGASPPPPLPTAPLGRGQGTFRRPQRPHGE